MHRDIRTILSQYSRDLRELSALYGDFPAINCAIHCSIIVNINNYKYVTNLFMNNKFYNNFHMHIFKNIKYDDNSYICNNMMQYCNNSIYIGLKYKFDADIMRYIHYISDDIFIMVDSTSYRIYSKNIFIRKNYYDNGNIMRIIRSAINKYLSRFN